MQQQKEQYQIWLPSYEYLVLRDIADKYNIPIKQLLPALILTLQTDNDTLTKTLNNMFKY